LSCHVSVFFFFCLLLPEASELRHGKEPRRETILVFVLSLPMSCHCLLICVVLPLSCRCPCLHMPRQGGEAGRQKDREADSRQSGRRRRRQAERQSTFVLLSLVLSTLGRQSKFICFVCHFSSTLPVISHQPFLPSFLFFTPLTPALTLTISLAFFLEFENASPFFWYVRFCVAQCPSLSLYLVVCVPCCLYSPGWMGGGGGRDVTTDTSRTN
jgi:hypothetical protein